MVDQSLGAYNIADLREIARRKMPRGLFEYLDRGAEDEVTLRNNRTVFEHMRFKSRSLVDVSKRSQAITLFGEPSKMPVMIGPTGFAGLCAYQGEVMLARAAAAAGVPYVMSASALTAMEQVMEQGGGTLWFQCIMWPDRKLCYALVERARVAGFRALVITTDTLVAGNREHNRRNGITQPFALTRRNTIDLLGHPRWMAGVFLPYLIRQGGMPRHVNYPDEMEVRITKAGSVSGRAKTRTEAMSWDDLRAMRKVWPHTLIVKGILDVRDALLAADCGAEGIIISNHGGRQLDCAVSPIEVLPEIVDAVGNRLTVLIDGGFQRGSDVVKALALGAKMVLLGRAPLYGLAGAGEAGVARALAIFREEIHRVMAFLGCNSVEELNSEFLLRQ